jgi:gluconate 5-dehydrogenase/2-deoxy-D-gluconate 3-dehydrogenase
VWILDTNLKGYFLVGQAVARHMVERRIAGAVVNTSSAGQLVAAPNLTHYCVAKAGIEMPTNSWRSSWPRTAGSTRCARG